MTQISLAYSPDSDDAFMVHALQEKIVPWGDLEFEFHKEDIQILNEECLEGRYDITAISAALFPQVVDSYKLLSIGSSVGRKFGPAIVVNEDSKIKNLAQLEGHRIAVPGWHTSAYFAAKMLLPHFDAVAIPFDEIGPAIASGRVDAGILIHELQLNYSDHGFRKISDLGTLWDQAYHLPLPLGSIVIKRSLPEITQAVVQEKYRQSIAWALAHRQEALDVASESAVAGLSGEMADEYIERYANRDSLDLPESVVQGLDHMFSAAAKLKLTRTVEVREHILPHVES